MFQKSVFLRFPLSILLLFLFKSAIRMYNFHKRSQRIWTAWQVIFQNFKITKKIRFLDLEAVSFLFCSVWALVRNCIYWPRATPNLLIRWSDKLTLRWICRAEIMIEPLFRLFSVFIGKNMCFFFLDHVLSVVGTPAAPI